MQASKDSVLVALDRAVRAPEVQRHVKAALDRTRKALPASDRAMTWEVVPLHIFKELPPEIQSCWVFVLGPFQNSGAERHPNSHQRTLCIGGDAEYQTRTDERWTTSSVVSDESASLDDRWASIPQNVWHQWVVGPNEFAVLSFHTCEADALIEERPSDDQDLNAGETSRRTYKEQTGSQSE